MNLYSHPDKYLRDHLEEVAKNCKHVILERILFPQKKEILVNIAYIMGCFHDLGKGTRYFQHYLLSPIHEIIGPKSHALISALFVKEVVGLYLKDSILSDLEKGLFTHFAFTAVKRHHGNLDNFENELYTNEDKQEELAEQIEVFEEDEIESIIHYFLDSLNIYYSFNDFKNYIKKGNYIEDMPLFYEEHIELGDFDTFNTATKIELFYFHQLIFSVLLLSDKRDVILENERCYERIDFKGDLIDIYRKTYNFDTPKDDLAKWKNNAFESSLRQLNDITVFNKGKHIYSVTLPTGFGKTITSFAIALKMKELLKIPAQRLIITIPFTSIIDQNFEVYKDILCTDDTSILLKHHHLAEPIYKISDEELSANKSQFLIETWQSEVVVTTFVQLLNSIFSNNKTQLMKLPNLANSIIILDEIQTIPYEYWQLIKNTFEVIAKSYNCYFILMSATQPLIFNPKEEIEELIPNYEAYFGYFNRTKLINKTQKVVTLNEFTDEVSEYLAINSKKDVLIILNTKKDSRKCFEILRGIIDFEKNDIFYLSTLITPYERKNIINLIKSDSNKRKIIVSTQLVEAGVDISVATVFRAIAPLDSIIQAAGRANRYNEKPEMGEIYLYEIQEMLTATSVIYGSILIQMTKNVLKTITEIEEIEYLSLIKKYFKEVRAQSDSHLSTYLEDMLKLNFKNVGQFSLIKETNTKSVFLQLNKAAKDIWNEFLSIWTNETLDIFEKKQEFAKIKSQFYDYVINVPIPFGKSDIIFDSEPVAEFYLSKLETPSKCYAYDEYDLSQNTGYREIQSLNY
jgi:CRISPR-associated endonuclease/helicase Cas3